MPISMFCWFRVSSIFVRNFLITITDASVDNHFFSLAARGDQLGDPLRAQKQDGGVSSVAATGNAISVDTWHSGCVVFASNNESDVVLDGDLDNRGSDTTDVTPLNLDTTSIGKLERLTDRGMTDGDIAEVTIWNAALSDDQITALSNGLSPLLVQNRNIQGYWPLYGVESPELDGSLNSNDMTINGSCPYIVHPPMNPKLHGGSVRRLPCRLQGHRLRL